MAKAKDNGKKELDIPRMTQDRQLPGVTEENGQEQAMLAHAIMTGVGACLEKQLNKECQPKHLRTGLNVIMCSHSALVRLLVHKGLISTEEYMATVTQELKREKDDYETRLTLALGRRTSLL